MVEEDRRGSKWLLRESVRDPCDGRSTTIVAVTEIHTRESCIELPTRMQTHECMETDRIQTNSVTFINMYKGFDTVL